MNDDDIERVEFWAYKQQPALEATAEIDDPMLSIGIEEDFGPCVSFYAYPDEGHNGIAEWIFRRPLRDLMQYWLEMHDGSEGLDLDHPEARLLSKLLAAYDEWDAEEKARS